MLAEAVHSALALMATLVIYMAVHVADKPADRNRLFGRGKAENLSALFEILLLLAASAWILCEADALHCSTDIWSSSMVILGLVGLTLGRRFLNLGWLGKADSIAALVVTLIVIYVSGGFDGASLPSCWIRR